MANKIRLKLEYNGAGFHGWQMQPGGVRSIQAELQSAIQTVLRESIRPPVASGRTDAGVHASGQIVTFFTEQDPDLPLLARSLSSILKGEVAVLEAQKVPDDFHPQRSSQSKEYVYTILQRGAPPTLDNGFVWHIPNELNIERMQSEALVLKGTHDFKSFQAAGCCSEISEKTIFKSVVEVNGCYIQYTVVGSGFLKQMVRIIVGTLVDMGKNKISSNMIEILKARDRNLAGITAPAYGLCLKKVNY